MKPEEKNFDESPILIPKNSFVEGYIKSHKAIRIECNFNGTIFTNNRVIVDGSSKITGDVICSELILTGTIEGNVFCVGRVTLNKGAQINGKVYTSMFTNEQETNLQCVIQITNLDSIAKANELLDKLDMESGLSVDPILNQFRELFYENAFARKTNPDMEIVHKFTEQLPASKVKAGAAPIVMKQTEGVTV
ncbi:MAG TPA: polymer-forming cytoskeletal protein [Bacteroidales bacterium]|nr:polymer-forming cytoskeletal protein [Bacteroidales bacterium]